MKKSSLLVGYLLALLSLNANATPILVGTTTNPTGINNLTVGSTSYDVAIGYTANPTSPFAVGSSEAHAAQSALADAFNSLGVNGLDNVVGASLNGLTVYIDGVLPGTQDAIIDFGGNPWSPANIIGSGSSSYGIHSNSVGGYAVYASASFSTVPEPQTLSLLGVGIVGLLLARTNKKRQLSV